MNARPEYLTQAAAAKVGDIVTKTIMGDSYPVEIVKRTPKTITVREVTVVRSSGNAYSESRQNGNFTTIPNESARELVFRQTKDGYFTYSQSFHLYFGEVTDRRDPSV